MLNTGEIFAGYRIERRLGAGGMGEVYVARHPRLPRSDALKVLAPQLGSDPQFRARFEREADLAASLSHPAIVKVYDRGESEGRLWIAMELVDGVDLAQRLRETGAFPASEVASVVSTIADALDRAAGRGLVHRDVKPANILLSVDGDVLLTDFGIARMGGEASDLTGTGVTVGTVNYASPEQLQGRPLDGRSDQYSLACTAFQLLTGEAPYADSNAAIVIAGHLGRPLPSVRVRRQDLAPQVDEVLARATAKSPDARYDSSSEFAAALAQACAASAPGPTSVVPVVPLSLSVAAPSAPAGVDPERTVMPPLRDPEPTVVPGPRQVGAHDAPTQLRAAQRGSRMGLITGAVAVIAVIAVVVGAVVWKSSDSDEPGGGVSSEVEGLPRLLATPELASLAQKPASPKWTYTPPADSRPAPPPGVGVSPQTVYGVVGGTASAAIMIRFLNPNFFLDVVSADTGIFQRSIALGTDSTNACAAATEGTIALCRITKSPNGRFAVVDLTNGAKTVVSTGLSRAAEPYVDGGRFVVSNDWRSDQAEVVVFDNGGKQVWREVMPGAVPLPGAGVVASLAETTGPYGKASTLSVRRVTDGKEVLRREAKAADQKPSVSGFSGGFAVSSGDATEFYSPDGTRTATAPSGWIGTSGKTAFGVVYRVPSLPVLFEKATTRIGAVNPRTGTLLWSRDGVPSDESDGSNRDTGAVVGFGTKVVQQKLRRIGGSLEMWRMVWVDAYSGQEGGTFDLDTTAQTDGRILGTDGTSLAYFVPKSPAEDLYIHSRDYSGRWQISFPNMVSAFSGRLYAGETRVV